MLSAISQDKNKGVEGTKGRRSIPLSEKQGYGITRTLARQTKNRINKKTKVCMHRILEVVCLYTGHTS